MVNLTRFVLSLQSKSVLFYSKTILNKMSDCKYTNKIRIFKRTYIISYNKLTIWHRSER